jgi:RNA polymerase sigma-70 factor (ECF subfamily)
MKLLADRELLLVQQACDGKQAAYEEIVEGYKKKVFYLAFDLTGSEQEAEDLSQEAFLKAFRAIKKFKGNSTFGSWLYRITVNTFLDQKRLMSSKYEKVQQELTDYNVSTASVEEDNYTKDPEAYAESRQIQMHIEQALIKLSPRERSVFIFRHYQGMPLKEIADTMTISEGTVKSLQFRAIKKLQKSLDFYKHSLSKEVYQ